MDETCYVLRKLILDEALKENDEGGWSDVMKSYVGPLLDRKGIETLPRPIRLAIAIVIIGTKHLDLFNMAFRLICDQEHVGGCFWNIQEEILRFSALNIFRYVKSADMKEDLFLRIIFLQFLTIKFSPIFLLG